MNIKNVFAALILLLAVLAVDAQYRAPRSNKPGNSLSDRIYFGGGGGLGGGNQYFNIALSPLLGYKITESFSSGLQVTYQYVKAGENSFSNYGGGPFVTYAIQKKFLIYSQYEIMSYEFFNVSNREFDRDTGRSLFAGIGWNSPINDNSSFQVLGIYDLIYGTGENSPYDIPWQIRAGFVIGF